MIAAIRLLLLTGWREQEVLTLEWSMIDFQRGMVTLPDSKTGRAHRMLGAPALAEVIQFRVPRLAANALRIDTTRAAERAAGCNEVGHEATALQQPPNETLLTIRCMLILFLIEDWPATAQTPRAVTSCWRSRASCGSRLRCCPGTACAPWTREAPTSCQYRRRRARMGRA